MKILQLVCDCGGGYVKKASTADMFVKYHLIEDGEERRCTKLEFVQEEIKNGKKIEVMEFDEFLKSNIGTKQEVLIEKRPTRDGKFKGVTRNYINVILEKAE